MNILFFEPFCNYSPPHFGTCLELMEKHILRGDDITFIGCDASLPTCEPNMGHSINSCFFCINTRKKGLSLLSKKIQSKNFSCIDKGDLKIIDKVKNLPFNNLEQLKKIHIDNFDLGWAVASSLMHRTRDIEIQNDHVPYIKKLFESALSVYLSFKKHLTNDKFDRVYIFNGRFAALRGVLRICQKLSIDCYIHERGATISKYAIFKNHLPHDLNKIEKIILDRWRTSTDTDKSNKAFSFYNERINGVDQAWFSFTKNQSNERLPDNWDNKKKNIVIYNSSEHEFGAIGEEWENPIYKSQESAIEKIVRSMHKHRNEFHIYLRTHPNLIDVTNNALKNVYTLPPDNFTIIEPDSPVSSYKMMLSSDKVISFTSTMGIEAAFWGKTSILAGMNFYRNLGSVYLPSSHVELIELLLKELPPLPKLGAQIYGYHLKTFGEDFELYQALDIHEGLFKGHNLKNVMPSSFWKRTIIQLCRINFYLKNTIKITSLK